MKKILLPVFDFIWRVLICLVYLILSILEFLIKLLWNFKIPEIDLEHYSTTDKKTYPTYFHYVWTNFKF